MPELHRHTWQLTQLLTARDAAGPVYFGAYHCAGCDRWQNSPISPEALGALDGPNGALVASVYAPPELDPPADSWARTVAARLPGETMDACPPPRILGSARCAS